MPYGYKTTLNGCADKRFNFPAFQCWNFRRWIKPGKVNPDWWGHF